MFLCSYRTFGFCMCFTVQFSKNCVLSSFVTTNDILSFRIACVNSFLILFSEEFEMFLLFPPPQRPLQAFRLANECYNTSVFRARQQKFDIF